MKASYIVPLSLISILLFCAVSIASADHFSIYVARKGTDAYKAAQEKEDETSIFAERTFHRALNRAAELLQEGPHTVSILVAAGEYVGKAKQGVWVVPQIDNPEGTLRLIGGCNDDFTTRQPFINLTALVTRDGRDGALLQLTKKSKLKELVISGFLFDAAPSNAYDRKTNSILKSQSRSYPLITLAMLATEHLVVDSNIFLNGAHGAFDPYIAPLTADTVVDITNNFFLNTIKTIQLGAGVSYKGNSVKQVNLRNNSFILNWPFNPDTTSSDISAIKLYHKDGAQKLNMEGNLFAYNPGGVMQHDWPEDRMPDIVLQNNLFYMNGALFGEAAEDAGIFAGKFGHNPKYLILDLETIEDDFDYTVEENLVLDPKIPVALVDLEAADSYAVQRKNTVLNDVRRLFALNQEGGTVAIANYAPAMTFNTNALPLPAEEKAKAYGVQPTKLWQPR
jgi:hypothetical protein